MTSHQGKRKRSPPLGKNSDNESNGSAFGSQDNLEDHSNEFMCPICFETIEDAQVTECGHTFCSKCIFQSLETKNRCPTCSHEIDKVFPNFMLNDIITKRRKDILTKKCSSNPESSKNLAEWQQLISTKTNSLKESDIDLLLATLKEKKKEYKRTSKALQTDLLKAFLNYARKHKQDQLAVLMNELKIIEQDVIRIQNLTSVTPSHSSRPPISNSMNESSQSYASSSSHLTIDRSSSKPNYRSTLEEFKAIDSGPSSSALTTRWRKMRQHFDDLEHCYLNTRKSAGSSFNSEDGPKIDDLDEFKETLNKITTWNNFKTLASLCYTSDPIAEPSIVSSIEFDKDNEIFATAGVTKIIKLFDYSNVIKDSLTINYPIALIECKSKISCVSWSSYYKSSMASSDYEGSVTIWDVFTKQKVNCFQEHERRCWSVDFNKIDTNLITSGSDDGTVKLWSLNMESSVATLKAPANVCCVKFNPRSRYHVAFASADHCAYYYDLRNPKTPEAIFKDHRKAVSYVKFIDWDEIVSASTDSQLKMWNTNRNQCIRTFKGHVNEKNFVGLASDGDYITCGSENNSLFLYYKGFTKPILIYSFDSDKIVHPYQLKERARRDNSSCDFVSAICWRSGTNVLIAANSQGIIKVLELI